MCIVRELITKYKSLDVDFWNGKTSCILMENRDMGRDQGEVGRRSVNKRFLDILLVLLKDQRSFVSPLSPSVIMLADEGNPAPYSSCFGPARATAMCFQLRDKRCPREWIAFLMVFCPLDIRLPEVSRTAPGAWMQVTAGIEKGLQWMVLGGSKFD